MVLWCSPTRSHPSTMSSSRRTRSTRCTERMLNWWKQFWSQMVFKWLRDTTGMWCGHREAWTLTSTRSCKSTKRSTTFPTRMSWRGRIDWLPTWSRCRRSGARTSLTSYQTAISSLTSSLTSTVTFTVSRTRNNQTYGSSNPKIHHKAKAFTS